MAGQKGSLNKGMWVRYVIAGALGFLATKVGPSAGTWLSDVTAVILGYAN